MDDCVFCRIIAGEIPAEVVAQDENFIAFLSNRPVVPGMTIVATRKHFGSYVFQSMDDGILSEMYLFVRKLARLLDRTLGSERCVQVMEGLEVDHAHMKLYPKPAGAISGFLGWPEKVAAAPELSALAREIRKGVDN